jgi:hypothetical protein
MITFKKMIPDHQKRGALRAGDERDPRHRHSSSQPAPIFEASHRQSLAG